MNELQQVIPTFICSFFGFSISTFPILALSVLIKLFVFYQMRNPYPNTLNCNKFFFGYSYQSSDGQMRLRVTTVTRRWVMGTEVELFLFSYSLSCCLTLGESFKQKTWVIVVDWRSSEAQTSVSLEPWCNTT